MNAFTECRNYQNCGEYLTDADESDFCNSCEEDRRETEERVEQMTKRNAELEAELNDLAAIIRRYIRKYPDYDQREQVWEYLGRKGLRGSITRQKTIADLKESEGQ